MCRMVMDDESPHRLRNPIHRHSRLLRPRRERPRNSRTAEQRHELASVLPSAPAMSDLSWPQSHTPRNRCVRFAPTVAGGHATLATKRTLLLTWAGLPPAGSHQLCLAHSFDHLVGAGE